MKKLRSKILKIDIDTKLDKKQILVFKKTRIAILNSLGIKVLKIIEHPSPSKKGHHFWIHTNKLISNNERNFYEFISGGDVTRYHINKRRIKRGFEYWSKLFSRVKWKRPKDFDKRHALKIISKSEMLKYEKKFLISYIEREYAFKKKIFGIIKGR